jgi:adenosine deaminase
MSDGEMSLRDPAVDDAFLNSLPKAELHVHIEGTLEPEMMFGPARRNGVALKCASVEEARRVYDFADLSLFSTSITRASRCSSTRGTSTT